MVLSTTYNEYQKPENAEAGFASTMNGNMDLIDANTSKIERAAVRAPGVGDDSDDGYSVSSEWHYDGKIWLCTDATVGAANWEQVFPVGNLELASEARGDLIYRGASVWQRLAKGTSGQFLKIGANDPTWASPAPADIAFASTAKILGRKTAGAGAGEECSLDELLDLIGTPAQGDILYQGASALARLAAGTKGQALSTQGAAANPVWLDRTPGLYYNAVINPQFQINQRALAAYTSVTTPANSDDTYLLDQWVLLSDGNDIVDVSQEATIVPPGAATSLKLEVETANKKFMKVCFLENKDALKFKGKNVSIQFKAYTVTGKVIENVRAAVLSWSGTADTITSDIVNTWGAEGESITPVANWTLENTPANLANVADAWTMHKIENIAVDTAGMTNLALAIWCDDTDAAVDDLLYIGDVQLNEGPVCLPFMPPKYADCEIQCMHFFEAGMSGFYGYNIATAGDGGTITYKARKRISANPVQTDLGGVNVPATPGYNYVSVDGFYSLRVVTATGPWVYSENWYVSAEL